MSYKNLPTEVLIDKCILKDPIAWAEFVKRFLPLINFSIKKALAIYSPGINQNEEIKDIRQNIMTFLWSQNRLNEVKNKERIDYWLAIIARNTTINHLKAKHKELLIGEEAYFERFTPKWIEDAGMPGPEDPALKLKMIYERLSPRERILFKFYFEKKLLLRDISKIMNLPLGTVSSAITRMRKKLKYFKK